MIRRDQPLPDGSAGWVLITQPGHAMLAGELAAAWEAPGFALLAPHQLLVDAVRRHDDGWVAWEERPEVDGQGRPVSFTEMEPQVAAGLWERSVELVADLGPLAQYLVAMHFVALRSRGDSKRVKDDPFVAKYTPLAAAWLIEWLAQSRNNTPELAARGLAQLQMFDALSLWLCCHAVPSPASFPTPDGPAISLAASDVPTTGERLSVMVDPWPFRRAPLDLEVPARHVAARHYASAADLAAAPARPVTLRWRLAPYQTSVAKPH